MKYLFLSFCLIFCLSSHLFATSPATSAPEEIAPVADHCFSIEVCSDTDCYYLEICVRTNLKAVWPDVPNYTGSTSKNNSLLTLRGLPEKMNGHSFDVLPNTTLKAIKASKNPLAGKTVRPGSYTVSKGRAFLKLGDQ
ncbi:MAG: hypothetical protein AAF587_22450 [Bacteroidota bacterium]